MSTTCLPPDDPSFPRALHGLTRQPDVPCGPLYVRGGWPAPAGVAIVGTRRPSREALDFTRALATSIVGAGWAVWSGGALGIDAAAHKAAMLAGGRTVVVCPSGFEEVYPPQHERLFEQVVERGGTLLSRVPDDARPTLGAFHHRNAVLAALTVATIVVQAGVKSGARSTARAARRLDRPLYVVPHSPWDERGAGCAIELVSGARALAAAGELVATLKRDLGIADAPRQQVLAIDLDLAHAGERSHAHAHPLQEWGSDAARVFAALGEMPMHADDLCDRTSLPAAAVTAALLTLTLGAVVVEAPAGLYRRTPPR